MSNTVSRNFASILQIYDEMICLGEQLNTLVDWVFYDRAFVIILVNNHGSRSHKVSYRGSVWLRSCVILNMHSNEQFQERQIPSLEYSPTTQRNFYKLRPSIILSITQTRLWLTWAEICYKQLFPAATLGHMMAIICDAFVYKEFPEVLLVGVDIDTCLLQLHRKQVSHMIVFPCS